ncbi:leucine-rich repeat-containing protein 40-like [Teratosphaeria destructans]|uniref:Leucine-rich repeat-containing protein 40-like n=1 Tax=Teratosphaeria destructans TaxID=418781 RepID=A0A9W7SJQ5_9PEZI|nr:leucine-rich repeat-containing protein 40-like [Teratosphaeria destructans]
MDSASTPQKPTGIPRPSRLPVLNKRPSQVFATPSDPSVEPARNTVNPPKLQKRTSVASLPRSTQRSVQDAAAIPKPPATTTRPTRALVDDGVKPTARTLSRPGTNSGRPPSRGSNSQRLSPAAAAQDEGTHDQPGSLDAIRSSSRQGCRDDELPTGIAGLAEALTEDLFRPSGRSKSRPSLSERAIESLQNLPTTPTAKTRRNSNFFAPPQSPMGPPPRPGSSMSRDGGNSTRPGTSDGTFAKPTRPASPPQKQSQSAKPASRKSLGGFGYTPGKQRSTSRTLPQLLQASKDQKEAIPPLPRLPSAPKQSFIPAQPNGRFPARPLNGSKTLAARSAKPKPTLNGAFEANAAGPLQLSQREGAQTKRAASSSANASSAALREQIAAAKAAVRKEKAKHDSPLQADDAQFGAFSSEMYSDPFNQAPKDGKHVLRNRIKAAWTEGKLNISALNLKQLPEDVLHMYDSAAMEEGKVSWAEVVDLTRLIAADNGLEDLGDHIFPDRSSEDLAEDEDSGGNQFGGLELLDLHGNTLQSLPMGLRRLERLTVLNLAHNKLDNDCLDVVSQITSLKELRLGYNNIAGSLPTNICGLRHLEVLDVQANKILDLPEALHELVSLRVLNLAGNQMTTVPMDSLHDLPLIELDVSSNALIASLWPLGSIKSHPTLQVLNVANNSLASLVFAEGLGLPHLKVLDVTNNRLTVLPPVLGWTELITLAAGDNKIPELPSGFASLTNLRNVNFSSNELRLIDSEIARMESLESLILASNPLRDKKYLTMNAADIKHDLRSRLEPDEDDGELSDPETVIGPEPAPGTARWGLKPNNTLDLAAKSISDDVNDALGSFLQSHEVKQLLLSSNKLTTIPPALWLGQDLRILDLSNNAFAADYFSADFELPVLQELNLSNCRLMRIEPLITRLTAPALRTLNISTNRLTSALPAFRSTYPSLTTLFAADNKFTSLTADALQGLMTVSLASNELHSLPAEVGLLWDEGLRNLDVSSNAFRVPNYRVLERGTEAVMRWLRERLPASGGEVE